MKIAHISINNILGIKQLELTPAGFNEISGPNGAGKTSVLEAVKAALGGGHDGTLIRSGETNGEVVLILDDKTTIRKRVTPTKSATDVTQGGTKVQRPADLIKSLTDVLSINPVEFLRAPKKDRVKVLLDTMPITLDVQRLQTLAGLPIRADMNLQPLDIIAWAQKTIYDDRTGTNRAVTEKESSINQLGLALPDAPAGVNGTEDEITAAVQEAATKKEAELTRIQTKLDGIRKETQDKIDAIRANAQAQIDAIKEAAATAAAEEQTKLADFETKAGIVREKAINTYNETVTPHNQALAIIRANRENVAKREQGLDTIKKMEEELKDLRLDAARQSKALDDIEAYKSELLNSLPIRGLEVRDGEVFRDGIAFDRLNTAQQVDIAVEIAKLRAGELGVICVDGLELLDPAAFEQFKQRAIESGLQLFVTRVSGDEFSVKSE